MKFQTFQKVIVRKESILLVVMILWVLYKIQQPHDDNNNNNQIRRSYYYGGVESITQKSFDNHHHAFYANNNSISQHHHHQRTQETNGDWVGDDNHNNNVEDTLDIDDSAEDEAASILESKVSTDVNDYGNDNHQIQQLKQKQQQQQDYLLIRPPYRIVQVGGHRTGSTFQLILLCSIVMMRDPNAECKPTSADLNKELQSSIINNTSFVVKTHNNNNNGDAELQRLGSDGSIVVFSSGGKKGIWNFTKYVQQRSQLERCASCEIREYIKFFNLTQLEISQLQEHMRLYTILRQCCGFQMSKYEALRLHGCNTTKYVNEPSYPHCEDYEKGGGGGGFRQVELDFIASPIPYKCHNPEYNWAKIGDCTKFRDATIGGKGMNGKELSKKEMKSCKVK